MLVEVFRTAANNGTKLNVSEVMHVVRQIADDTGKLKTYLSVKITHSKIQSVTEAIRNLSRSLSILKKEKKKKKEDLKWTGRKWKRRNLNSTVYFMMW